MRSMSRRARRWRRRRSRVSRNASVQGNSCEFCGRENDLAK